MMNRRAEGQQPGTDVIESAAWLRRRIESLVSNGNLVEALGYVNRLLSIAHRTETRLYCYRALGVLACRTGDVDRARGAFEQATVIEPEDASLTYALGYCAARQGRWWHAMLHSFEALHVSDDQLDRAEFLRVAATATYQLGAVDTALSMLLGALDRDPDNPWILETVGHLYEREEMWFDALDIRQTLIDVVSDGLPPRGGRSVDNLENPAFLKVFQRLVTRFPITRDQLEARRERIIERLRGQIGLARSGDRDAGRGRLAPLHLPTGLSELVHQLALRDRNFQLLESAQSLWARARHRDFDRHLPPMRLAAGIHLAVERLHWRIPTDAGKLSDVYGVDTDAIRASARLLIGQFEVSWLADLDRPTEMHPDDRRRLEDVERALLFDAEPNSVKPSMLG
jgi:tetratricopeptide (TPR) repeat protein